MGKQPTGNEVDWPEQTGRNRDCKVGGSQPARATLPVLIQMKRDIDRRDDRIEPQRGQPYPPAHPLWIAPWVALR